MTDLCEKTALRHDWTLGEVREIHDTPLFQLIDRARRVHLAEFPDADIELCTLLSVKTGGCPEDCSYCSQSSHHKSPIQGKAMLQVADVVEAARRAKALGARRFCMGAAWRGPRDGTAFERVCEMVSEVKALGLETCVTLGMLTTEQALRLKAAGLDTYNHNLDTSADFYPSLTTTRTYGDRLATLRNIREAGLKVCCGGIIGLGESVEDRCGLIVELACMGRHPESVPVNALVRVPGTPLASLPPVEPTELVRMIATARITMPRSRVRLSAGRSELSREAQLLCMYAGANSIFYGEELLTTPNASHRDDDSLIAAAGLRAQLPS